jgi:hypothetical protein
MFKLSTKKTKLIALLASLSLFVCLALPVQAVDLGLEYARRIDLPDQGDEDIRNTAADIIRYLITFLGIIATAIILYGGFIWMTAAGNEDRVAKAKRIIVAGAIGLAVIIAAYAIVTFVIDITQDAINGDI